MKPRIVKRPRVDPTTRKEVNRWVIILPPHSDTLGFSNIRECFSWQHALNYSLSWCAAQQKERASKLGHLWMGWRRPFDGGPNNWDEHQKYNPQVVS